MKISNGSDQEVRFQKMRDYAALPSSIVSGLMVFILAAFFFFFGMPLTGSSAYSSLLPKERLDSIKKVAEKAVRSGQIPGAVLIIGDRDRVIYRKAFGYRSLVPVKQLMTVDTIFDLSSLTKVVATSTAVMQLVEKGQLHLEDRVAEYWPEFKKNGKKDITVRELLTHYSGLRPDLDLNPKWSGYDAALRLIVEERPIADPGTRFIYSDINFEILGELIRRITGQPLDIFCTEHIFKPLGMKDTGFNPSRTQLDRIAPTEYGNKGQMIRGEVHDPTAQSMGGIAGHAGLFSTANDLAVFARMLLKGGSYGRVRVLSPLTVEKMTTPQTPPNKTVLRGLGWDIDSPFASNRGELFPVGSFGHTGYAGTSIWIDPVSGLYIIILTNRVHPNGHGDCGPIRTSIATIVSAALGPISEQEVLDSRRSLTGYYELMKSYRISGCRNGKVLAGIDALEAEKFRTLSGMRVGLITNHSGVDSSGQRTVDLLYKAPGVELRAIFTPEHGLSGREDGKIPSTSDPVTGLPVYSLYGDLQRPAAKMMRGLDALVFDVQDAGVRFYTYITTMGYAMETAAREGIAFYVLDRPDPITGSIVQGPVMDRDLKSFTGYFPLALRYGMTMGELAEMFNAEYKIGAKLHVVKMQGYNRTDWYDETGLPWTAPSPNLRTLTEAILYPGVAMVEGANVSVGRGTGTPFELLGAPWIDGKELSAYLNSRKIQGVRFMPVDFVPENDRFRNELCHGVQIVLVDRQALDPAALGIEIASALFRLFPGDFMIDKTLPLVGSKKILDDITSGRDPQIITSGWQNQLDQFSETRSKYLLY
jgi:uncharacterized protein YbbC (DUF1343 family)/CubicO group peptidase (beta-lactamase class C family)